jgi:hypothetical protein
LNSRLEALDAGHCGYREPAWVALAAPSRMQDGVRKRGFSRIDIVSRQFVRLKEQVPRVIESGRKDVTIFRTVSDVHSYRHGLFLRVETKTERIAGVLKKSVRY